MPQCNGTTKKARQCKNNALVNFDQCRCHVTCRGVTRENKPCGSRAEKEFGYFYCRADHDPRLPTSTPTNLFRLDDLKARMKTVVLEYRSDKDAYTLKAIDTTTDELDHVVELHLLRDAYDRIVRSTTTTKTRSQKEKQKVLLSDVRTIANGKTNLNFTPAPINHVKFKAVDSFLKDYAKTDATHEDGLFHYLVTARSDIGVVAPPLTRSISHRIHAEIEASGNAILDALNGQCGDGKTWHDDYRADIEQVLKSMKL
jgi:hypothetical protein